MFGFLEVAVYSHRNNAAVQVFYETDLSVIDMTPQPRSHKHQTQLCESITNRRLYYYLATPWSAMMMRPSH